MSTSCSNSLSRKLRAGQPQVVCASSAADCECKPGNRRTMVLQSFGLEETNGKVYQATTNIPLSTDFIGMSVDGTIESANFQATQYTSLDGNLYYAGNVQSITTFTEESALLGFNINDSGLLFNP